MKACGLIVEYNPFHNGHLYHVQEAKNISHADCMIAVMSGSFLQRGEPAIIDKFHRAAAALLSGVDIVIELPYPFAVQSSHYFAKGSVLSLAEIGVSSICFGSETGLIEPFIDSYHTFKKNHESFRLTLRKHLNQGVSFPQASEQAYEKIGLTNDTLNLSQPNNILGFSYVKAVMENQLPIELYTIKRAQNEFHDGSILGPVASATSIRAQLEKDQKISDKIKQAIPDHTTIQLQSYHNKTSLWHMWEQYFPFLRYRVMTMSLHELQHIHGVEEGIENRIKQTAKNSQSFTEWMETLKTKRYTWTRLQRIFVHILTNTSKAEINNHIGKKSVPYLRVLGMTKVGRKFLNENKKQFNIPLITQLTKYQDPMLAMEERASLAYYSILPTKVQQKMMMQELSPPLII